LDNSCPYWWLALCDLFVQYRVTAERSVPLDRPRTLPRPEWAIQKVGPSVVSADLFLWLFTVFL
jgi:hypothetical protein